MQNSFITSTNIIKAMWFKQSSLIAFNVINQLMQNKTWHCLTHGTYIKYKAIYRIFCVPGFVPSLTLFYVTLVIYLCQSIEATCRLGKQYRKLFARYQPLNRKYIFNSHTQKCNNNFIWDAFEPFCFILKLNEHFWINLLKPLLHVTDFFLHL